MSHLLEAGSGLKCPWHHWQNTHPPHQKLVPQGGVGSRTNPPMHANELLTVRLLPPSQLLLQIMCGDPPK